MRADSVNTAACIIFGIAGRDYVPLQNVDAFQFFDPLVRCGDATYETAGALRDGERVWVLARLRGDLQVTETDKATKYLLLSNSHDGNSSVQVKITPVRVVCNNTLTVALSQRGTLRVRHDRDVRKALEKTKELLVVVNDTYAHLERLFHRMAAAQTEATAVNQYLLQVFPDPHDATDWKGAARADLSRRCALHLWQHGSGNEDASVRDTIWAAHNGVPELIDHQKPTARGADCTSRRLHSVWFGSGASVKARALHLATEWVESISPS